jgi:uroporphyrinogen decarboxylase
MDPWQRVEAALKGEAVDHPPIALWRHFPEDDQHVDKLVAHTLDRQRAGRSTSSFMPSAPMASRTGAP